MFSCEDEPTIKPPAKLRFDHKSPTYKKWKSKAGYSAEIAENNQTSLYVDYNSEIEVGNEVLVLMNEIDGNKKLVIQKIVETGFKPIGSVTKVDEMISVRFQLDQDVEVQGTLTRDIELVFNKNEVVKSGKYFPADIVDYVSMQDYCADLYLHHYNLNDSINFNYLASTVIRDVESNIYYSDDIVNYTIDKPSEKVYSSVYRSIADKGPDFQFYVTDSTNQFVWGMVLVDFKKYENIHFDKNVSFFDLAAKDRLVDNLEKEINQFIKTFEWDPVK